jgi:hypothetical protein
MYLLDPTNTLRRLIPTLKPGGRVVVHEHDMTMVPARKIPLPLHEQVQSWFRQTLEREGVNLQMGFDLYSVLSQACLLTLYPLH